MSRSRMPLAVLVAVTAVAFVAPAHSRADGALLEDLIGTWSGEATRGDQATPIGLSFARGDSGTLSVSLDLPALWLRSYPMGLAVGTDSIGSDGVPRAYVTAGPFSLVLDRARGMLTGDLPRALVPVHSIPFAMTKGSIAERAARPEPEAPQAEPVWTFDAGSAIWSGLACADGLVYAGADDGRLCAIDAGTGTLRWDFRTQGAIRARPTEAEGALYVHSDDGFLYCLDARVGTERWRSRIEAEPVMRIPPTQPGSRVDITASAPLLSEGRLLVGTHDGNLVALDPATGDSLWKRGVGGSVLPEPCAAMGRVFAGGFGGSVVAFDAASGARLWSFDTGAPVTSSPAAWQDVVVVGSRSYDIFGLNASTGVPAWNRYVWFSWIESSAAIHDGIAYVGSSDAATLLAIEAKTGRVHWQADVYGLAWGRPLVRGDRIFIGTRGASGGIDHRASAQARDRATGRLRWHYVLSRPADPVPYGFNGSAASDDRCVFFATVDGRVLAFSR